MKEIQACVLFLYFLISCQNKTEVNENNDIYKITLASQEYMGNGPFLAIEIDNTLKLKYYGGRNSNPEGFHYGNIPRELWDSIKSVLNKFMYNDFDSIHPLIVDDREIEMFIHSNSTTKHIHAQKSKLSKDFIDSFDKILNIYKFTNLEKTSDSLKFETSVQVFSQPPMEHRIEFKGPK